MSKNFIADVTESTHDSEPTLFMCESKIWLGGEEFPVQTDWHETKAGVMKEAGEIVFALVQKKEAELEKQLEEMRNTADNLLKTLDCFFAPGE